MVFQQYEHKELNWVMGLRERKDEGLKDVGS